MVKRVWAVDFDGTLVNSEELLTNYEVEALRKMGIDVTNNEIDLMQGKWPTQYLPIIFSNHGFGTIEEFYRFAPDYDSVYDNEVQLNPGVTKFINKAKKNGDKIIIVSSGSRRNIVVAARRLNILNQVDHLLSVENVENTKPAPDLYLKAQQITTALYPEHELIAIEDSETGVKAASAANVNVMQYGVDFNDFFELN